jgi:hypothetical protein
VKFSLSSFPRTLGAKAVEQRLPQQVTRRRDERNRAHARTVMAGYRMVRP